ncbi:MAG: Bax inhibitor-1/YccA family protein [Bacteroidia bacterium]
MSFPRNLDYTAKADVIKLVINRVLGYMALALAVSGMAAYLFTSQPTWLLPLVSETGLSVLGWIVLFTPVGIALVMQGLYEKLSYGALLFMLILYSGLLGISLSFIFFAYTAQSIALVFFLSAGMFGGVAFLGYTTKADLSKIGGILMLLMWGIILAALINLFLRSDKLSWIISFIGVFVFTGLTAYQMQKIRQWAESSSLEEIQSVGSQKLGIIFGLQLYILFINLFLSLLRLLGQRRD